MADEQSTTAESAIPIHHTSGVQISSNGSEVTLLFVRNAVTFPVNQDAPAVPVVAVTLPRGSAEDLRHVLVELLETLTKDLGPVDTPFLKGRRQTQPG